MIISSSNNEGSLDGELKLRYIIGISLVAALGGLLFGYDWVVIGGAKPFYEKYFGLTEASIQGWAMSSALVGCLLGSLSSGSLGDFYGRKKMLFVSALIFAITSLGTGWASSFTSFILWRIAGGVAIGLASNLSPMYIAEIAPASWRGRLVSLNQLTIVVGVVLAQAINWMIADPVAQGSSAIEILNSWNGQVGWRWMFWVTTIPSVLFLIGICFVPESPRWLLKRGKRDQALAILTKIGGEEYASRGVFEMSASLESESEKINWRALLEPRMLKVIGIGMILAVFQQWCGINVIFNYAEEIFSAAGYGVSAILFNMIITGAVNLVFTFVAFGFVDRIGRRRLMLTGSIALSVIYLLLGSQFYFHRQGILMLILVLMAIGAYAMSLAPVVWVVLSEIFPNRVRGAAMSISVSALWVACFVLTYTFPILNSHWGAAGTFWVYAGICIMGALFIYLKLPETKGKSLEEIEGEWGLSKSAVTNKNQDQE